jgi:lipopolysaccharide assembly outer membrane protein LptD (OstA)
MTIKSPVFRVCHRPLFRVTAPVRITFDFALHPAWIFTDQPLNPEDPQAREALLYDISSYGEEFLPVPSNDGVPFQLYVHYVSRGQTEQTYMYAGDNYPPYKNPVFVAYNLFSLQADKVKYDAQSQALEANGNVVVKNESGATQRADSVTFSIKNGQVARLR